MEEKIFNESTKDKIRRSPHLIFDYDDIRGTQTAFKRLLEIFSVEASRGHGGLIEVTLFRDLSLSISLLSDRGLQLGCVDDDGKEWKKRFTEFHPCQKNYDEFLFGDITDEGEIQPCYDMVEEFPFLACNQYVTEFMTVTSGNSLSEKAKILRFCDGEIETPLRESPYYLCGTDIRFRYDSSVFSDIRLDWDFLSALLREAALINRGIKYVLTEESDSETEGDRQELFCYGKYTDYVRSIAGDSIILPVFESARSVIGKDRPLSPRTYTADVSVLAAVTKGAGEYNCFYNGHRLDNGGAFLDEFYRVLQKKVKHIAQRHNRFTPVTVRELKKKVVVTINIKTIGGMPYWGDARRSFIDNAMITEVVRDICMREMNEKLLSDEAVVVGELYDAIIRERTEEKISLSDALENAVTDYENGDGKGALVELIMSVPVTRESYDALTVFIRNKACLSEPLYYYVLLTAFSEYTDTELYNHLNESYSENIGGNLSAFLALMKKEG